MRRVGGLSELADAYDSLLCDVWGVIHNGQLEDIRNLIADEVDAIIVNPVSPDAVRAPVSALEMMNQAGYDFARASYDTTYVCRGGIRKLIAERRTSTTDVSSGVSINSPDASTWKPRTSRTTVSGKSDSLTSSNRPRACSCCPMCWCRPGGSRAAAEPINGSTLPVPLALSSTAAGTAPIHRLRST